MKFLKAGFVVKVKEQDGSVAYGQRFKIKKERKKMCA